MIRAFLATAFAAMCAASAFAQSGGTYPVRPIRVIVPYSPGGGADLTARVIGAKLAEALGQSVVVENRPGANGVNGTDAAAKSAPDGHTLLVADRGALGINPALYAKIPYDSVKDFEHVAIATYGHYLLVVNKDVPAATFQELVALAKAKPGSLNYGSIGIGSITQLSFEALKSRFGIDLVHVPYKGAAPAAAAAVAGEVQVSMGTLPSLIGHVREGRLRPLVFGAPKRSSVLPDVPTIGEVGGTVDTIAPGFFAFTSPAGTPRPIVNRLAEEIAKALRMPDVAQRFVQTGLDPNTTAGDRLPAEMTETIRADVPRFAKLVRDIGIKPE
jgi:tripartite-type tricarboxylate transporter receptor subunit TctC